MHATILCVDAIVSYPHMCVFIIVYMEFFLLNKPKEIIHHE